MGASTVAPHPRCQETNPGTAAFLKYSSVIYDSQIGEKAGVGVPALRIHADVAMNPMKYLSGNQWQPTSVPSNRLSVLPNRCWLQPHVLLGNVHVPLATCTSLGLKFARCASYCAAGEGTYDGSADQIFLLTVIPGMSRCQSRCGARVPLQQLPVARGNLLQDSIHVLKIDSSNLNLLSIIYLPGKPS